MKHDTCYECNNIILTNIYKAYDCAFCSIVCRICFLRKYKFTEFCQIECTLIENKQLFKTNSLSYINYNISHTNSIQRTQVNTLYTENNSIYFNAVSVLLKFINPTSSLIDKYNKLKISIPEFSNSFTDLVWNISGTFTT